MNMFQKLIDLNRQGSPIDWELLTFGLREDPIRAKWRQYDADDEFGNDMVAWMEREYKLARTSYAGDQYNFDYEDRFAKQLRLMDEHIYGRELTPDDYTCAESDNIEGNLYFNWFELNQETNGEDFIEEEVFLQGPEFDSSRRAYSYNTDPILLERIKKVFAICRAATRTQLDNYDHYCWMEDELNEIDKVVYGSENLEYNL